MARSSADDMELKRGCEAGILAKGDRDKVVMCMRVAKSRGGGGGWAKGKLTSRHNMAKPRVLAVTGQSVSPSHFPIHAMLTRARMLLTISSSCFTRAWRCAAKAKGHRTKTFLRVLKYSNGGVLEVTFFQPSLSFFAGLPQIARMEN